MSPSLRLCILALFAGVILTACGGGRAANTVPQAISTPHSPDAPKTSAEDLNLLINMPFEAEDCVWKVDEQRKTLTAVLRFEADDTTKLVADLEKIKPAADVSIASQTWFPNDLIVDSELRGDDQLKGKAFAADPFYQEPYTAGRLIRVSGTDYFVLELTGK